MEVSEIKRNASVSKEKTQVQQAGQTAEMPRALEQKFLL